VPRVWSDLDDQLLMQLTASLPLSQSLTSDDWRDLHSFAFGHRGFDLALPVLLSLAMTEGFARWLIDKADASGTALWARAVLQGWDWSRLRHEGVSRGRDDAEGRLRALVQAFLQDQ
jgi:tRNA(Met) cytidine acetyltransferase